MGTGIGTLMPIIPGRRLLLEHPRRAVPLPCCFVHPVVPDLRDREVYLCGNPAWMTQVQQTLQALGVSRSAIHAEEFSW